MMDQQLRKIVALACEYRCSVDVVFEKDGDIRIAIYPGDNIETNVAVPDEGEALNIDGQLHRVDIQHEQADDQRSA